MRQYIPTLQVAVGFLLFWFLGFACGHAIAASAQALADPIQVYTSADPVREGGLGLAMPDGRYAVSKGDGCVDAGFDRGMNVILWQVEGFSGVGTLGVVDEQGVVHLLCNVRIERQMDPTPCFKNAEGACDVALEQ